MRCFKSFFKHTWHPQQMDNPGRFSNNSPRSNCPNSATINETELGELKIVPDNNEAASPTTRTGVACYNGGCKTGKGRLPQHRLESPWHYLKTIFLISIIVALVVWIIIYVILVQYEIL